MKSNLNKHLTLDDRRIIERGIRNASSKSAIADILGKDKSTIGKEIKLRRVHTYKCKLPLECSAYAKCKFGRHCSENCPNFIPFHCKRRDRSPGACNGCDKYHHCRFDKFIYKPELADNEYRESLINSRLGINASLHEIHDLGLLIKPLLDKGHSPYQILNAHPEINLSEKTLYSYIENNVFKDAGVNISVMNLRRQVSRKLPKNQTCQYKKRKDFRYLKGRLYKDFLEVLEVDPSFSVVEMDTVYNDVSNGPFIQTFKFIKYGFMFAILHPKKDSAHMLQGVNLLEDILGHDLFEKEVQLLLTDRGPEFVCADEFEIRGDGTRRTRVYYCDPMQSGQKGSLENNHIELRYICPKEIDLYHLGLKTQNDLNLVLSHINSTPKEKLNGKSPIELTEFLHLDLMKKFYDFGLTKIDRDEVILKPYLLKK